MNIAGLFSPLKSKIFGGLAIVALLGAGVQTIRLSWVQTSLAKALGDLRWAKEERAHFETKIIDRTAEALAKAKIANLEKEKEYADKARTADANYADLRRRFSATVVRSQAGSGGSGSAPGSQGSGAGVPEIASTDSRICLSDADAAQIADLAAYAMAAHEWAITLDQ